MSGRAGRDEERSCLRRLPGSLDRRSQSGRAGAHDDDIGLCQDIQLFPLLSPSTPGPRGRADPMYS